MVLHLKPGELLNKIKFPLIYLFSALWFILLTFSFFETNTNKYYEQKRNTIDFNAYLTGALVTKNQPNNLYNEKTQYAYQEFLFNKSFNGLLSFRNTPLVALVNIPYTFIAPLKAYKISFLVESIIVVFFIFYLAFITKSSKLFIPLSLIFIPTASQSVYSQVAIVIALIYAGIFHLFKSEKYFWAGALTSFLILKAQYLIAFPYLFIISKDKKSFLAGFTVFSALLVLVDSLIYKSFYLVDYVKFLLRTENRNFGTDRLILFNVSNFLKLFNLPDSLGFIVSILFFAITLLVILYKKNTLTLERFFISLILWNISITIHSAPVDLIFLLIPITLLMRSEKNTDKMIAAILFFIPLLGMFEQINLQGFGGAVLLLLGFINIFLDQISLVEMGGIEPPC